MLQAKVKPDYRYGKALQAFSRLEFVKDEWRDVPAQFEEQARQHEWLEVRDRPVVEEGAIETLAPAPIVEEDEAPPTSEQLLDKVLEGDEEDEALTPSADKLLEGEEEETKKTRRGRSRKSG